MAKKRVRRVKPFQLKKHHAVMMSTLTIVIVAGFILFVLLVMLCGF